MILSIATDFLNDNNKNKKICEVKKCRLTHEHDVKIGFLRREKEELLCSVIVNINTVLLRFISCNSKLPSYGAVCKLLNALGTGGTVIIILLLTFSVTRIRG